MEHKERTRTSISPLGLNKSTPDNVVEDGALEVCHNLRFANGAWRNVQEFNAEDIPATLKGKDILYTHPVSGKKNYITKESTTVKETRVKYYGMRSQPISATPKASNARFSVNLGTTKPIVGILDSVSETYYLDKPLREAQSNPHTATIYNKDLERLGVVAGYYNGKLSFYNEEEEDYRSGLLPMWHAEVSYFKLGEMFSETFYFVVEDISATNEHNDVFVKRGDNYLYFGTISSVDTETNTYAIWEKESGTTIACTILGLKKMYLYFPYYISLNNDTLFYFRFEENALFLRGYNGIVGYMSEVDGDENGTSTEVENSSTPKFKYGANGNIVYYYLDDNEEEKEFKREFSIDTDETDEAYLARYEKLPEEQQIWGREMKVCLNHIQSIGGQCALFYSWQMNLDNYPPHIDFFYGEPSLNITEEVEVGEETTLVGWDSNGNLLNSFGLLHNDFTLDHFGNMLIARTIDSRTTEYYLYSENQYHRYGNMGNTTLSMSVSIKDSIHCPKLTDVPMFYKAAGISASDGSLDGRMFLGVGEPVLTLDSNLNRLNPASNSLMITNENGYFRGELALFAVARAEDGTEIYRTPPQLFRSETLLDVDADVFIFQPNTNELWKEYSETAFDYQNYHPYSYLIWHRELWEKAVGVDKNNNSYKKWDAWSNRTKKRREKVQSIIDKVTAADLYKLKVELQADGKNIKTIALYSTRLYPLFVFEKSSFRTNTINLLDEPFYEMCELTDGEKEYTITYNDLANIETKTDKVYKLTQSAEDTFFSQRGIEYNNRYHAYDIETLRPPLSLVDVNGADSNSSHAISHLVTSRLYNNMGVYASYPASEVFAGKYDVFASTQQYIMSFQESLREVIFGSYNDSSSTILALGKFTPDYSTSLNCSYIVNRNEDTYDSDDAGLVFPNAKWTPSSYNEFVTSMQKASRSSRKYNPISLLNLDAPESKMCSPTYPIKTPNRIQVSEYGNPLTNPYNLSYRIGTTNNEIITMNSVAVKLSDAKFGEFPLYVFTKEGIYAMQTGTETAYSNIIPIAKDVAINPNTLATSGAVFFFTEKGLHAISKDGVQLISAGLHEDSNRIPDWMYTCKLVHLPEYNEIMCVLMDNNVTTGKAYIFSIDNQCWSEREVPQGQVFNDHEVVDLNIISDLESEGDVVKKDIVMETRPIKLGANKELKRLETLVVRFEADKDKVEELEVTIKGSIDGVNYKDLRKVSATTNTDVLIRRTPASVKYLKFVVKSDSLQSSIRLIRFDTEHYLRFVRKMR